jgi:hypothetical protein
LIQVKARAAVPAMLKDGPVPSLPSRRRGGECRMSIIRSLFRLWMSLTVLAVAIDLACFWLVEHLPAARTASEGNIYLDVFLISVPAPVLLSPVLALTGLVWGLLRSLSRLARRPQARPRRLSASGPARA